MKRSRMSDWLLMLLFVAGILWLASQSFVSMAPLWRVQAPAARK